jgi:hypothetical protein
VHVLDRQRNLIEVGRVGPRKGPSGVHEQRAHALAAVENGVAHRLGQNAEAAPTRIQGLLSHAFEMFALIRGPCGKGRLID